MGWGVFYIYGVFFTPLTDDFGWSRAVTSAAYSICILISGAMGIVAGKLSDQWGPKKVIMGCTIILASGYVLMALIQNVWQLYLLYGLVIAIGLTGSWSPPLSAVAHWFVNRRGLMTGIVSGGISIGTLIMAPAATQLISAYGWRKSYVIIGIAVLVIVMISAQFFKPSSDENKTNSAASGKIEGVTLREVLHTRIFWLASIIYFCFGFTLFTIMVHIVPDATGLGISPIDAAFILSIIGITGMTGRIIVGVISDKIKVKGATIISLILLAGAFLWLQQANSLWKLDIFAVFFGFSYGGISCLQSLLAVELFGLASVGVTTAIFGFAVNIGGGIGPVLAGYIFDISGSYKWAFLICLILVAIALIISFSLRPAKKNNPVNYRTQTTN